MSKNPDADTEEGEIIDDDFEEISDNSIISDETGKSLFPKEHLPVISLSSVSDEEVEESRTLRMKINRIRKFHGHRHHGHHHHHKGKRKTKEKCFGVYKKKKWKRLMNGSYSSSSGDSESFNLELGKLQHQLKAAIRVQPTEDYQKNSLKARLRAMTKADEIELKNDDLKSNIDTKVEEKQDLIEEVDDELIQLRLEALKTAVLNKFEHRKKRKVKEMEENEILKSENLDTNKENTGDENVQIKKLCLHNPDIITPPDEDEDVLRALLLASMSKKITKDIEVEKVEQPQKIDPKPSQNIVKPKVFTKNFGFPLRQHIPPKIKPIIININTDSDTDDEKKTVTNTKVPLNIINSEIESTVDKFLKEQRAKVEAQFLTKKVEPPLLTKNVEAAALTKKVEAPVTPQPKTIRPNHSTILEKSAVKLLPKFKQIEYQKLLQRLKNAQKKPRVRKISIKGGEEVNSVKKIVRNKTHSPGKPQLVKLDRVADIKQDARSLHNALKQMQKMKNGRLQIEEKYVVLTPIIRKINEATSERKRYDQEVKRLMAELADAKVKLHDTHRNFSMNVRELMIKKEEIDKSTPQQIAKKTESKTPHTSTPNKINFPLEPLEVSTIPNTPNSTITNSSTPKLSVIPNLSKSTDNPISPFDGTLETLEEARDIIKNDDKLENQEFVLKISEMEAICKGNNSDVDDINPGDPNDVHRMYEKQQDVLKYVSPLDSVKRDNNFDPFVIMCPFDIDGNCRDAECTYKHYSR